MTGGHAHYDEFGYFAENAAEAGLEWRGPPEVARRSVVVGAAGDGGDGDAGRSVSALVWGRDPELVLLHGGGQNAHTWDTVALALDRPLVAVDLPGHGHSDWPGEARALDPASMADDVAAAVDVLAPAARTVVGMSLGGLTSIALAARRPDLVGRLVLVDITPGVDQKKSSDIVAFLSGPETFASFDEILQRTVQFNPDRSLSSLRRGVLHNAVELDDGRWAWRHQLGRPAGDGGLHVDRIGFTDLWDALGATRVPVLLVRGERSPVVDDADVAELLRRRSDARVVVVEGAGHSIQGDRPVELAALVASFMG